MIRVKLVFIINVYVFRELIYKWNVNNIFIGILEEEICYCLKRIRCKVKKKKFNKFNIINCIILDIVSIDFKFFYM